MLDEQQFRRKRRVVFGFAFAWAACVLLGFAVSRYFEIGVAVLLALSMLIFPGFDAIRIFSGSYARYVEKVEASALAAVKRSTSSPKWSIFSKVLVLVFFGLMSLVPLVLFAFDTSAWLALFAGLGGLALCAGLIHQWRVGKI